jgi:hypothetical protein
MAVKGATVGSGIIVGAGRASGRRGEGNGKPGRRARAAWEMGDAVCVGRDVGRQGRSRERCIY